MSDALIEAGALLIAAATVAWVLVGVIRRYSLRRGVLDSPTDRSSHVIPTPRGGGAGVVVAAVLAYLLFGPSDANGWRVALALAAILPTALAGWIDDLRRLPVLPRFGAHLLTGLMLLPLCLAGQTSPTETVFLAAAWLFATVSAINVVNFMDGIDGLIGLQAVVFGLHITLLSIVGTPAWALGMSIAGASAAFLLWNWAPARIFLGDVGSGALAVLGLIAGILLFKGGTWPFVAVFLPLFPIFLDAVVTLSRRARQGERLTAAHRTHLYQRLANEGGWGHARVAALYGATATLATAVVFFTPRLWTTAACVVYALLVAIFGGSLERTSAVRHRAKGQAHKTEGTR